MRIAPESRGFTILLGLLAALPALSIDISAPTLALLPKALATSTTVAELTLSLFVVGFAVGQLGAGRLSDRRGRRPVLLGGLGCYTVAAIACALAPSGSALLLFRLAQGIGAGACSVLSFAMVQDLFEGEAARAKRSYVTVVFGAVPMLAPAIGAGLSGLAGWRSVYGVLAIGGGLLSVIAWLGVAESRRAGAAADPAGGGVARPKPLRGDSGFVGLVVVNALSYGCIFAYIAGSPIVIINQMRLPSTVFAAVFAGTAAALTAGAWASGLLGRRSLGATVLLGPSLGVAAAAAPALALASLAGGRSGLILLPPLLAVMFARGIIAPNLQHLAIERQRQRAGAASAAVGVSQLLAGALVSAAVAVLLPDLGPSAIAVPMAVLAVAAAAGWCAIRLR